MYVKQTDSTDKKEHWLITELLSHNFSLFIWRTIIMIIIIITFQAQYDTPIFQQSSCVSKQVSFNYLHVICGLKESVSLDWFRSGNTRGFLFYKKSNYLTFFQTQILAISYSCTFFLAFSSCYIHYFQSSATCPIWNLCAASFFRINNIFNTNIIILFQTGQS